ncbi:hypothetical protein RR46_01014 [Papilio xuthus]|uniref:Uncharacterized protein n=1 Tax=Papilio xuthus TaxID=66420 RepID=A0A0N0PAC6_PAPXU|nr:hypothetical protein RR46_01014 [Papilio xuthus]
MHSIYTEQINNKERIKDLEAEKSKLHKAINAAIDDGLRALQKEGGGAGEQYLAALKLHMQAAGEGTAGKDTGGEQVDAPATNNSTNATSLRRFDFKKKKKRGPDELDEIFIYKDVYENKDIEPEQGKMIMDNRHKLEKKLFEWMVKRQEEKKRLKEYLEKKRAHLLEVVTEKCPRFGYGKRIKKKKTRRKEEGDAVDAHRKEHKNKPKYPCCRKCCKKSYLGCL